jgi:hypothetical protein
MFTMLSLLLPMGGCDLRCLADGFCDFVLDRIAQDSDGGHGRFSVQVAG